MLENTFLHIPGIGEKTERMLWRKGVLTWTDFLNYNGLVFSKAKDRFIREELKSSFKNKKKISFFKVRLSSSETWRLFKTFRNRVVYLDIETSGGYQGIDEITVIGIYDGEKVKTFVNGVNLDEFEGALEPYDLMVTFNGACFDIPFIRRQFRNISLPAAHIDLRFVFQRLGYKGGLKKIEKDLGLERSQDIQGMDGYQAVILWRAHQWGEKGALEKLIRYNTADIVNLKPLMEIAYKKMIKLLLPVKQKA
jgi:uncharacterized protein YprB with RNaseH-like and TPR domain